MPKINLVRCPVANVRLENFLVQSHKISFFEFALGQMLTFLVSALVNNLKVTFTLTSLSVSAVTKLTFGEFQEIVRSKKLWNPSMFFVLFPRKIQMLSHISLLCFVLCKFYLSKKFNNFDPCKYILLAL